MKARVFIQTVLITSMLFTQLSLYALEHGAYVPDYRLKASRGAENALGRPMRDPAPQSWDRRIISDFSDRSLPTTWLETSWSVRLGTSFDNLYYHVTLRVNDDGTLPNDLIQPEHVDYLDRIRKLYGTRITLSLIGEEDVFLPIADNDELKKAFIDSLEALCIRYGFQGVDMDWEFPSTPRAALRLAYTRLCASLSQRFKNRDIPLSIAISRWRPLDDEIFEYIDRIHLMAYDGYGRHSTYEGAISDAEYVVSRYNLNRQQLVLGLPYYGRIWDPSRDDYWRGTQNYREIVEQWKPESHMDEAGSYYFNGPDTIERKTKWAAENGFAGVFVWEPFYDIRGEASLTTAILSASEDD